MCAKKKRGKKVLIVIAVLLALCFAALLGVTYFANSFLNRINRAEDLQMETLTDEEVELILSETDPPEELDADLEELDPLEVTLPDELPENIEKPDHVINILLIGQDRRPGEGRQRSDAMILCTVNKEQKILTMTSFLRDTYVKIPEYNGKKYSDNRLNVPYVIGGMEMLDECLMLNFGIEVDHNIEVDFSAFEQIVDALGGVDIELTRAEANWMGGVSAGMNRLNGKKALEYARIRKLDSDFGRTNRQRNVLNAMLLRVESLSVNEMIDLVGTIFPMITTDMTNGDILGYVTELFPLIMNYQVITQTVPGEGEYRGGTIRGMSVLVPDLEKINARLRETIGS